MTVDDGLNMVRIEDVLMSPDGELVFYSKSELDWDENKRKKKYYMVPADGGEARQFIGDAGGSAFRFSPEKSMTNSRFFGCGCPVVRL
jgi:dipeptidyl aminopeptidase/acylaminoacyl peptidase